MNRDGVIAITSTAQQALLATSYRVKIDGVVVGRIREMTTERFRVAPGTHVVQLRFWWMGSRRLTVEVAEGQACELVTRPGIGRFIPAVGLFLPNSFLSLNLAPGSTIFEPSQPASQPPPAGP
jgi:hypothetical protein